MYQDKKKELIESLRRESEPVSITDANFFTRLLAFFLDFTFIQLGLFAVSLIALLTGFIDMSMFYELILLHTHLDVYLQFTYHYSLFIEIMMTAILVLYFAVLESQSVWGTTPGKKIVGIRVVDDSGSKISFKTSLLRNVSRILWRLPVIVTIVGFLNIVLLCIVGERRLGDYLAGTRVARAVRRGEFSEEDSYKPKVLKKS